MRLQDTGLQVLRNEVTKRSEELSRTVAGLEERHPARSPALSEQSEIQQRLQSRESAFEKNAQQNVRARLTATLQQAQQVEREARERLRDLESQAGSFAANFREAMRLTAEMRKRDQELQELRDRLNFLNAERQAIGFVRLVSAALPAETPQGIGRLRLMAMILLAALGLGLALPTVIDLLDRRVLAPRDAERALGIGAAGWIVDRRGAANQLLAADQTRRLASMLLRQCKRGPRRVFGFTSARVGGGTTELVHELAHVLGQLGSRVLVVDTNTLQTRAGAHETPEAGATEGPTLADLLAGRATPDDVVHTVERDGRSVALVPCGATPDSGIERVDRLREALDHWSAQWDIVLVDVAPLLPSADAELLIDTLGQVFLVVEAGNVPKGDVVRARAALQRLDPEAVGLIVTRVPPAAAGVQAHQIEGITGDRFDRVVQHSWLQLQWQLLRMRWTRMRAR